MCCLTLAITDLWEASGRHIFFWKLPNQSWPPCNIIFLIENKPKKHFKFFKKIIFSGCRRLPFYREDLPRGKKRFLSDNAFNLCPWFGQSRISLDNVILSLDNVMTFLISSPILDNVAWFRLSTPDYGQFCTFSYISQNIMDNSVPFV